MSSNPNQSVIGEARTPWPDTQERGRKPSVFSAALMWMMVFILAILFVYVRVARAEMRLDPPEVLLERAKTNRVGYMEVLRDIDKNIPEMRLRAEADLYLDILDELEDIGNSQNRDNLGATVFKGVANRLGRHALRWVRFEMDTEEQVLAPHQWVDPESAYDLVLEHRNDVPVITEPEERVRMANNLEALETYAVSVGWPRFAIAGYATLRSEVALESLSKIDDLPEEQQDFWLRHLSPTTGFDTFLRRLHDRVLTYPDPDPIRFHRYASILAKLRVRADEAGRSTPYYIRVLLGDVSRDLITAHFYQEVFFTGGDFESLIENLNRSQLQHFVYLLNDSGFAVRPAYLPHLLSKGRVLVAHLKKMGMPREAEILERRLKQIESNKGRVPGKKKGRVIGQG